MQQYPIAAVDLNLVVRAGRVSQVRGRRPAPRAKTGGRHSRAFAKRCRQFTVRTRLGFDSPAVFEELLPFLPDIRSICSRFSMVGLCRRCIALKFIMITSPAPRNRPCPVLANGNIWSADKRGSLELTGARGLMIGRGVIRNPWLFHQIRQRRRGEPLFIPTGRTCWDTSVRCMKPCDRGNQGAGAGAKDEEVT